MAAPPEGPARVATGTPASTSMPTPAAAMALTCNTVTPASVRTPPSTMSRPKATMSLFRTPSSRTATPPADEDGGDASQGQESHRRSTQTDDNSEQTWTMSFICKGAPGGQEFAQYTIDRNSITFGNLITMKSKLGYGARDYLYYKRRCGNAIATLNEIEYDVDANAMLSSNAEEREVRLVLSRDQITERNVEITPIKLPRMATVSEDFTDESINDYKVWLNNMHEEGQCMDFKDIYREDTVKTYKEWLRVQGQLDDISAYDNHRNHIDLLNSSQDSNPTPLLNLPSHARREKTLGNNSQKRKARGTIKGLAAMHKRSKQGSQKLKLQFSRLGGAAGENTRTFTDEIVVFTRKKALIIGVRTWRDIHEDVKKSIASDMMHKWDIEDNEENRKKIWTIANERYKGWRSTFSATYRAYTTYDERMRHKPEELDIVEWHYLVLYFGSEKFQRISNKNSQNRQNVKIHHLTGSKSFSQCSFEQRDPLTGDEPNDLELFMLRKVRMGDGQAKNLGMSMIMQAAKF
ncbi:uncharacterized protein LOC110435060 isoform X2 [Sorghum bicolor]|uniref:uncharacterized protein LOC110435060 isoform X2 n=1 Tax=Sorghum bicolor TaxID=4558 RepID=UPI000B4252A6|nr:uncharacterized protein LOC110435060 isoform X2 [Sorghum bicolor]|eukprot:XP_021316054.1 uncharacterized protein LOC110435060 isoform X2 [Sorghum bicolor]